MNQAVLLAHLKPETEKINILMREDLRIIDDALLREVLTHALFNGGKRVRPLLCSLAARICGSYSDSIFHLAIAFEYLHVATLLHDDVIDQAEKRRGQETVSRRWGSTPAILAGDFLHARSMFLIGSQGGIRCLEIICKATAAMVEGEFLQLHNASNLLLSENDYLRIIKGKTAVLIAAVCETGAVSAGATAEQQKALYRYGMSLGLAFQVVDDILDYLGEPGRTGKMGGNDLIEGKMTLPLIHALAQADPEDHEFIRSVILQDQTMRRTHIDQIGQLIEKYNGFAYARSKAAHFIQTALNELNIFTAASTADARTILVGLAEYILTRKK